MTKKTMLQLISVVAFVVLIAFSWNLTSRAAYESAEYSVIETDGQFEIRRYPDLMLASTSSSSEAQGNDGSFMRLFQYISGANEAKQKVAMTTPVFMEDSPADSERRMGFVLPKDVATKGAPHPVAADVKVRTRKGGYFAVVRFSGKLNAKAVEQAEQQLRKWIESKGLKGHKEFESAGYDPPLTPGPLRRNEVLIRLETYQESETGGGK